MKLKNILITACDTKYFASCLTLISHVQQFPAYKRIDRIFVYNLGMTQEQIDFLNRVEKTEVVFFPEECKTFHDKYLDPKTYAWKMYALYSGKDLATNCVFYLDAGIVPIRDFSRVYDYIERDKIFLVGSLHKIGEHITEDCKKYMAVKNWELNQEAITAGIQGYKVGSYAQEHYIKWGFALSKEPKAVCGPKYGEHPHRHDQTLYSIMAHRLEFDNFFHDLYKYSGWKGPDMHPEQIFWVHRRAYLNFERLKMKG